MSDLFDDEGKQDLAYIRQTRMKFIEDILGTDGRVTDDDKAILLRALKDAESTVLTKAKISTASAENDTATEHNLILASLLFKLGQGEEGESEQDRIHVLPENVPSLPEELESIEIVPGECKDSTKSVRDLTPETKSQ